jgi:hypothetical protein
MASQRIILVSIGGQAARAIADLFVSWRTAGSTLQQADVDRFCEALLSNRCSLPILDYCEWVDRWSAGNLIPGPGAVAGRRFETTCLSPVETEEWASRCGNQWQEQITLASRLREVAKSWGEVVEHRLVLVIREVLDVSTSDEQVKESLGVVPTWLQPMIPGYHS